MVCEWSIVRAASHPNEVALLSKSTALMQVCVSSFNTRSVIDLSIGLEEAYLYIDQFTCERSQSKTLCQHHSSGPIGTDPFSQYGDD